MMEEFRRLDLDPVLSDIADGILDDEARHLGFNHIYLEDRFASLHRLDAEAVGDRSGDNGHSEVAALLEGLHRRIDLVMARLPPVFERLNEEFEDLGMEPERLLAAVDGEAHRRLDRSAKAGQRIAKQDISRDSPASRQGTTDVADFGAPASV